MVPFETIRPIRETTDLSIYCTISDGVKIFIKEAKTETGKRMNTREFHNQEFLRQISQEKDVGFEFLKPTLDGSTLSYPDINESTDWLAKDFTPGIQMAGLAEYQEAMLRFMKFCLQISYSEIPQEIKDDAQKRMSNLWGNFEKDAVYLQETEILHEPTVKHMRKQIEEGIDQQAFQHHDVVPWHMARKHSDGKLILIDSGWSGWSLKYYDIAYYVLQMIGYAERMDDALTFLKKSKDEFARDSQFQKTLATPLSYRGIRLAAELHKQGKVTQTREVISLVLNEI